MHFPYHQSPWHAQQYIPHPNQQPTSNPNQQNPLPVLVPGAPQQLQGESSFALLPVQGLVKQPGLFTLNQGGHFLPAQNGQLLAQLGPPLLNLPGQAPPNRPGQDPRNHPGQPLTNHPGQPLSNHPGQPLNNRPGQLPSSHHGHFSLKNPRQPPGQVPFNHPGRLPLDHCGHLPLNNPGQLPSNRPGHLSLNHPGQLPPGQLLNNHRFGAPPGIGSQIASGHPLALRCPPIRAPVGPGFSGAIQLPSSPRMMQALQQGPPITDQRSTLADVMKRQATASTSENAELLGTDRFQTKVCWRIEPTDCAKGKGTEANALRPPITEYFEKAEKLLKGKRRPASDEGETGPKRQRREAPKAPAWKSKGEEAVDVSNHFALEDIDEDAFKKVVEKEEDPHRLAQRQKQIDFGKNTLGYERYLELVPKSKRQKEHPRTPRIGQVCSKRSWDGQIKKWRRLLHQYDPPADEEAETAVQDFLPGYKEREKSSDAVEKDEPESEEEKGELGNNQALVFEDDEDEFVGL